MPRMPSRQTLTVDEACAALGVSRNSLYLAIKRDEVPAIRIGRRIVIPRVALERMLEQPIGTR